MKIERCICGNKANFIVTKPPFYIICLKDGGCWMGPDKPTKKKAIKAWNKVMSATKTPRLQSKENESCQKQ